jgi:hypothetical protein
MAEETTYQFLARRERELTAQVAALRGQLGPKEAELAELRRLKASTTIAGSALSGLIAGTEHVGGSAQSALSELIRSNPNPLENLGVASPESPLEALGVTPSSNALTDLVTSPHARNLGRHKTTDAMPPTLMARFAAMTIKELVIQALLDHFPNGGTAAQIRDFMRDAYQRVIEPSSVRPQMHRLKADNVLMHDPATDIWNLYPKKRMAYTMFNHPTSRAAMEELQDDALRENESGVKLRDLK